MVLWEISVATAYFLGLKRTYRLALKIQRRIISPKHPKIRQFLQRRTRIVFHIALSVHKKVQQRDLEVGRSFGNWILRWLDHAKPSAQIRSSPLRPPQSHSMPKHMTSSGRLPGSYNQNIKSSTDRDSGRRLFSTPWNIRSNAFPTIAMIMRPPRSVGVGNQYRQLCTSSPEIMRRMVSENVFRKDIAMWMQLN